MHVHDSYAGVRNEGPGNRAEARPEGWRMTAYVQDPVGRLSRPEDLLDRLQQNVSFVEIECQFFEPIAIHKGKCNGGQGRGGRRIQSSSIFRTWRGFAVVLYSKVFWRGLYHVAWRPYFPFIQP